MYSTDVLIIGGGITGLSATYYLQKFAPTTKVTLIEAGDRLGGKILTEQIGAFVIEGSADSFLSRKPAGMELVRELGLDVQGRIPENRATFVQRHGKLHPLPEGLTGLIPTNLDALTNSTLLSAEGVERVRQEPTIPPQQGTSEETIAQFITRRMGQEAYENLIEPLMGGIYGGRADLLSIDAIFPQLVALEQREGSLLRGLNARPKPAPSATPPFVSFAGGMGSLVSRLKEKIYARPVDVRLYCRAANMEYDGERYAVETTHGFMMAEKVIITTPAYISAELLETVNPTLAFSLREVQYSSAAIVTVAFDESELPKPLSGYGYVIPRIEGKEVLACTWSSSKWANRAPDGSVLVRVYLGRYGVDVTTYDDATLLAMGRQEVLDGTGISAAPTVHTIHRWSRSVPQYTLGHRARVERIRALTAQHDGLAIVGSYFDGVGIPDCIRHGKAAAASVQ